MRLAGLAPTLTSPALLYQLTAFMLITCKAALSLYVWTR